MSPSPRGRSASPAPAEADVDMENGGSRDNKDAKVIIVTNLTRNVVESHLRTIFGVYGEITKIDLPLFAKCKEIYSATITVILLKFLNP